MNRSFQMGNFSFNSETSDKAPFFDTTPEKRRKFSTKDCQECQICSDEVFQVIFSVLDFFLFFLLLNEKFEF